MPPFPSVLPRVILSTRQTGLSGLHLLLKTRIIGATLNQTLFKNGCGEDPASKTWGHGSNVACISNSCKHGPGKSVSKQREASFPHSEEGGTRQMKTGKQKCLRERELFSLVLRSRISFRTGGLGEFPVCTKYFLASGISLIVCKPIS